jgi:hypothetical protein
MTCESFVPGPGCVILYLKTNDTGPMLPLAVSGYTETVDPSLH